MRRSAAGRSVASRRTRQYASLMIRNGILVCALVVSVGCGKKSESPAPAPGTAAPAAPSPTEEARALFKGVCATCHGEDGMGDGPGAAALNPKPRNYTDKAWQAATTDEQIKKIILGGG